MIKQDLYNNLVDTFIVIEPKKQQIAFFPKEESQMFQSEDASFTTTGNPLTESENTDADAFAQRSTGSRLPLNSSHTATDYIGAVNITIPTIISEEFTNFLLYDSTQNTSTSLYSLTDTSVKLRTISTGVQSIKIPTNVFNTILTDQTEIEANNNSNIQKNYGKYYINITPKYIRTQITNVNAKAHFKWDDISSNNDGSDAPLEKRRNVYEVDKTDFSSLAWDFENTGSDSGRLYGSVVEIWNSSETVLKQTKIMTENKFNFGNSNPMKFVLYPDNFGYDVEDISIGDIVYVYPRESHFNNILLEIDYKDANLKLEGILSFILNDVARDITTGTYEVYDDKGFKIDDSGKLTGTVVHRYQVTSTGQYELRKKIKK